MFRIIATTTVLLAATATAATALQGETWRQRSVEVVYGDLNPLHPEDAKILAARLEAAARSVCRNDDSAAAVMGSREDQETQECMKSAINVAMARIKGKLDEAVRANFVSSPAN